MRLPALRATVLATVFPITFFSSRVSAGAQDLTTTGKDKNILTQQSAELDDIVKKLQNCLDHTTRALVCSVILGGLCGAVWIRFQTANSAKRVNPEPSKVSGNHFRFPRCRALLSDPWTAGSRTISVTKTDSLCRAFPSDFIVLGAK
jgi:hypothetical protein